MICQWRADKLFAEADIDLRDTDKSRYFAITDFNNCFIIRSQSLFFLLRNIFGKGSDLPFSRKSNCNQEEEKTCGFNLRMSRILFAAKQSQMILGMSRTLFVGSYLQITWWALGQ